jgi:hypothetical protein
MKAVLQTSALRQSMVADMTIRNLSPRTREIYTWMVIHVQQGKGRKDRYVMLSSGSQRILLNQTAGGLWGLIGERASPEPMLLRASS